MMMKITLMTLNSWWVKMGWVDWAPIPAGMLGNSTLDSDDHDHDDCDDNLNIWLPSSVSSNDLKGDLGGEGIASMVWATVTMGASSSSSSATSTTSSETAGTWENISWLIQAPPIHPYHHQLSSRQHHLPLSISIKISTTFYLSSSSRNRSNSVSWNGNDVGRRKGKRRGIRKRGEATKTGELEKEENIMRRTLHGFWLWSCRWGSG